MSHFAKELTEARVANEVIRAGRGDDVTLSDTAVEWLRDRIAQVTPTAICERLGFGIFEARRLIARLCQQGLLCKQVKMARKPGGREWAFAWA